MLQRTGWGASRRGRAGSKVKTSARPGLDPLEGRALMAASLAPIANVTAPAGIGYQVPLDGSGTTAASQSFTVSSSNPAIKATVAQGPYVTFNITHTGTNPTTDPSFTGSLTFQLFNDVAPTAVSRIEQLVNSGFYNGESFYRIAALGPNNTEFIAQGGVNNSKPAPSTGFPFQNEFSQSVAFTNPGQLALANGGFTNQDNPNDYFTNSTEFFVTQGATRFLDFGYTIFGQIVAQSSPNLLNELMNVATQSSSEFGGEKSQPISAVTITSASISTASPDGALHIDATGATAGQTSTIDVTAFDPSSNTSTSRSFTVTVGATNANPGPTEKPFLSVYPSVSTPIATAVGQPAIFQVQGVSAGSPSDPLTYTVAGSTTKNSSTGALTFNPIPSSQGTATVSPTGIVTVTPAAGYTGPITVLVGVRDQTDRTGKGLSDVSNYDVKQFTVNVSGTTPVSRAPIARPFSVSVAPGSSTTLQLEGLSGTTGTNANLTYTITSQPTLGTLTNFDPATGTVVYTPTSGAGTDTFTYTTTDTTNHLTSAPGKVTVTIEAPTGVTGAVRLISDPAGDKVLVVTPPPNKTRQRDVVAILQTTPAGATSPVLQVEVNGVVDTTQPVASSVTQIVVYGSRTGTTTVVAPDVAVPVAALNTGHGGKNSLTYAGTGDTTINSWFGHSVVQGGSGTNAIVGQQGHFRVVKSAGTDSVFVSPVNPYRRAPHWKVAGYHLAHQPLGAFYRFVGNKLVKTNQPVSTPIKAGG